MDPELNYEDMDDLALSEHIEWNHAQNETDNTDLDLLTQMQHFLAVDVDIRNEVNYRD